MKRDVPLVVGPAANAECATLTVTYDLALSLTSGADTLGLESAQVTFTTSFDTSATYIERFRLPAIDALSSSLTIAGSGSADGAFPLADPVAFYPLFSGQFYTTTGEPLSYDVNGSTVQLLVEFSSSVSQPVPEPATLSLLGLGLVSVGARRWRQRKKP